MIGMRKQEKGGRTQWDIYLEGTWRNTKFCDVIVADALYAKAPFINEVTSQGSKPDQVKQDDYLIVKDAEVVCGRAPT